MAYMAVFGECWHCHQLFSFSASKVPSVVINGEREPLCLSCVQLANRLRAEAGLPPIIPEPGAYEPDEVS